MLAVQRFDRVDTKNHRDFCANCKHWTKVLTGGARQPETPPAWDNVLAPSTYRPTHAAGTLT